MNRPAPDLVLKRLRLRNWLLFPAVDVTFPDHGLVLVTGAVGVGKTGLGEAIGRAVLGVPGRIAAFGRYSTHDRGDTYTCVDCELRGKPLRIEAGFKCEEFTAAGAALRYSYGGKARERAKSTETRAELSAMLGVDPFLAEWTVCIDGDKLKFNRLAQEESVGLLMAALSQPSWAKLHERARGTAAAFQATVDSTAAALQSAKDTEERERIDLERAVTGLAKAKSEYERVRETRQQQIEEAQVALNEKAQVLDRIGERRAALKVEIERLIAAHADEHKQLEIEAHEAEDRVQVLNDQRGALSTTRAGQMRLMEDERKALKSMLDVPANCPTCGKAWDKAYTEIEIKNQRQLLAHATAMQDSATDSIQSLEEQIKQERAVAQALRNRIAVLIKDQTIDLRDEDEKLENEAREHNRIAKQYELALERLNQPFSDSAVKVAESKVAERDAALKRANAAVETAAAGLLASQETLKVGRYWQGAFAPAGIPNMVLEEALGPLNEISRGLSQRITGGRLSVVYNTSRGLADGREKAQLVTEVVNKAGSSDLVMTSKGQSGLVNFIIAETLAAAGNLTRRIGFRWYDEVLPHQDPVYCRALYGYMRETARQHGILVFLVDHNPAAENYADYVLSVEEKDGVSSVSWIAS